MKPLLIALALIFAVTFTASAQNVYFTKEGNVTFFSKAPLENIEAHNQKVSSFLKKSQGELVFSVPIRAFRFDKKLMQEHFNEKYMESDKYPEAKFVGKIVNLEDVDFETPGTYNVTVEGDMTIHGVTQRVKTDGTITVTDNDITANAKFPIRVADYKIQVPSMLTENIAEVVDVTVDISYKPYEAK